MSWNVHHFFNLRYLITGWIMKNCLKYPREIDNIRKGRLIYFRMPIWQSPSIKANHRLIQPTQLSIAVTPSNSQGFFRYPRYPRGIWGITDHQRCFVLPSIHSTPPFFAEKLLTGRYDGGTNIYLPRLASIYVMNLVAHLCTLNLSGALTHISSYNSSNAIEVADKIASFHQNLSNCHISSTDAFTIPRLMKWTWFCSLVLSKLTFWGMLFILVLAYPAGSESHCK